MNTVLQASLPVLAASGLSGSLAVAVGALVVVLAIVLVFVMVLRSNGAARKTAGGLGYDAQRGPLGQPQPDGASPWQRQSIQQAPWQGQNGDFGAPGAAPGGRPKSAPWGQTQYYPGAANAGQPGSGMPNAGGWGAGQGQPQANEWGAPGNAPADDPWQTGGDGGWGAPQAPASRPAAGGAGMGGMAGGMNGGAGGGWEVPATGGAGAGLSPWDQAAAPSRPGAGAGVNGGSWGTEMPSAAGDAADWGAPPATSSRQDWNAGPASRPRQDWNAAPQAPQGFEVAGGYGEIDKTRVVRPSSQQALGMIVVRQGKEPGRIFEVRKDRLTIGRSRESDIFLEDLAVSRLHTTVARDESGRYILRDENSANGTYVNGQRISEHVLDEGDEIQVGQTVLAFVRR